MKKIFFIFAFLLFALQILHLSADAQPSITWQRLYDGPDHLNDGGRYICPADNNSFFVAGYIGYNTSPTHIFVMKILFNGDTVWTKSILLNGVYGGRAYTITNSGDGGCVITGDVTGKKWTVKLNSNGNVLWQKIYSDTDYVICNDIKRTINNNYLICGNPTPSHNYNLYKIDANGNLLWQKMFPFTFLYSCDVSSDDSYITAGNLVVGIIIKLKSNGDTVWSKKFNFTGNYSTSVRSIKIISKTYLVSGNCYDSIHDTYVGCFTKFDTSGNRYYTKVFLNAKNEIFSCSNVINPNRYVFSFFHREFGFNDSTYNRLLITDSSGNIIFQKYIYSSEYQEFYSIQPAGNGDLLFVGETYLNVFQSMRDIYIIRTDSMLNFPPIGVNCISQIEPDKFTLYQNYPNPFNPVTKIKFEIPTPPNPPFAKGGTAKPGGFVTLVIYNVLGKETAVLVNEQLAPGTYEVQWDASEYPSGVYFYMLEVRQAGSSTRDYVKTKKMVLLK